ncbi:transglutaminase domain-containing protein [Bacteroides sp. 224]|uniref:transglutaminase domain-containing protein n=1 Tax=Bacteroides sp. 224 TaxID=2302936 RepID=UPI0013D5B8CC|nr:transglutaminase domain-containing protein [Bacteroides sp. 224]NDV64867.1 transglutaminase domain-containing protein [Bacteroides sp. 224]
MNLRNLLLTLCACVICIACNNDPHFITDEATRQQIENDLLAKQQALPHGDLFNVLNQEMTTKEKEALQFLYAYMPIGDIADYSGDFYRQNIQASFQAQREMPWGRSIPEVLFRHFVLPVRVNNENMDESRMVFYKELKDRVKNLSLYDAVLEVNHWCHEKVIYTPSDSRTSSPLASVRTAYGRCGEESVFTVAALRAVGIPARQVYTPRWAHTDNNHAWVEAWVDGKWYFLGACEPEPVLNMAWFNEPVARGMLMHTKVFGKYNGPEDIMEVTNCFTEINVTENYAPVSMLSVNVQDKEGNPVPNASVEFKLYNHAEFYTVAQKTSNEEGKAFLSAGKGDALVWVTKDNKFGYQQVSFGKNDSVVITLSENASDFTPINLEMEIIPPVEGAIKVEVTDKQKKYNSYRLNEEDSIRNIYVSTFYTEEKAKELAKELNIDTDQTIRFMIGSRGNWSSIETFLRTVSEEDRSKAMHLLSVISDKDLRDIPTDILLDHLHTSNPRVSNEMLTAYRSFFKEVIDRKIQTATLGDASYKLIMWVNDSIKIDDTLNPQRIPITPIGVWKTRVADRHSRNILFVSMARSLDIPARLEPVTGKVQYMKTDSWINVDFEEGTLSINFQGDVVASYKASKVLEDPKEGTHFTIAKILPNGKLQTQNLASYGKGNGWSELLKKPYTLDKGNYILVTGTRMAKGNVLTKVISFQVNQQQTTKIDLVMRENTDDIRVIGNIDAEAKFNLADTGKETSILATTGRGYFIIGILGSRQEPTNHAMRDIAAVANKFNDWGRSMILLFKDEQDWKKFDTKEFGTLPTTITYGIDTNQVITKMIAGGVKLSSKDTLPIFIIADTFGRVVFVSQGYTIGLGEQIMSVVGRI